MKLQLAVKNNSRPFCHSCNFVWPATWLGDSEVSLLFTMPLSGWLSVRSLCCSCWTLVSSSGCLLPHFLSFHLYLFFFYLVVVLFPLFSFTFSRLLISLTSSQMSQSSLCSLCSETQDPGQMGVLINSKLRVTNCGSKRENECMHGQHDSRCCLL